MPPRTVGRSHRFLAVERYAILRRAVSCLPPQSGNRSTEARSTAGAAGTAGRKARTRTGNQAATSSRSRTGALSVGFLLGSESRKTLCHAENTCLGSGPVT